MPRTVTWPTPPVTTRLFMNLRTRLDGWAVSGVLAPTCGMRCERRLLLALRDRDLRTPAAQGFVRMAQVESFVGMAKQDWAWRRARLMRAQRASTRLKRA